MNKKGELLLSHLFEGVEMQPDYMKETMARVFEIWQKPVHIATVLDKEAKVVTYNGETFEINDFDSVANDPAK
jgi:stage V sporulation protein R